MRAELSSTSSSQTFSERFATLGKCVFSHRLSIGLAAIPLAALIVRPRPLFGAHPLAGTLGSLALVVLGLSLRAWAGGSAGGHTRTATLEAPRLATGGPYAYVRNPIYLATIVLGLGMVGLLGDPWMFVLCVGAFALLYVTIVPAEERFLRSRFGLAYERYCAEVPRLIPRLRPWSGATPAPFNWRAARGEAHIALICAAIYVLLRGASWLTS